MKLIDADRLLDDYDLRRMIKHQANGEEYTTMMVFEVADIIKDAPAVEAVLVKYRNNAGSLGFNKDQYVNKQFSHIDFQGDPSLRFIGCAFDQCNFYECSQLDFENCYIGMCELHNNDNIKMSHCDVSMCDIEMWKEDQHFYFEGDTCTIENSRVERRDW